MSDRTRVCVILVDRANYGRMKPVMQAILEHDALDLQVVCGGTMVLERFGSTVDVVRADGFEITSEVYMELEGSTPLSMSKSVGIGILEFSSVLHRLAPDIVLLIGDRYEAMGAALAAAYMNLMLVHIQGGEVSGSVDESARHAISKFAHYHVPSTERSAEYLVRMGEDPATILTVGCPSSDLARQMDRPLTPEVLNGRGSGSALDPERPFLLVIFHPSTTEFGDERTQVRTLLRALAQLALPTLMLWPNIDAGSSRVSKEIRKFRDEEQPDWLRLQTNLTPDDYLVVLSRAAVAVGNSSSFVRDSGFFGTPVVLVGSRQDGREADQNVTRVDVVEDVIVASVRAQVEGGRYAPSTLYGDGYVSGRVAQALSEVKPYVQKRLYYVMEDDEGSEPPS